MMNNKKNKGGYMSRRELKELLENQRCSIVEEKSVYVDQSYLLVAQKDI